MTREPGLTQLLLGLCVGFAVVNGIEWVYLSKQIKQDEQEMQQPAESNVVFDQIGSQDFVLPPEESYSGIVERPVMIRGRRPVAEPTSGPVVPVVSREDSKLKLMGIVMTPSGRKALLQNDKGVYKRLEVDTTIDTWELTEIYADRVVLTRGGSRQELKLRKPKPKTPSPKARTKTSRKPKKQPVKAKPRVKPRTVKQGSPK